MIKYVYGMLLVAVSFGAAAADAESIRHEIEIFLSSGIGGIVSIVLLLLFLMWLVLPLAIFGLKSRVRQLKTEVRESNRMLAEIMASNKALADTSDTGEIRDHIDETNRILADIRDELSVLNDDDEPGVSSERQGSSVREEGAADYYDEIKYEP
jgi:hypothetical protein